MGTPFTWNWPVPDLMRTRATGQVTFNKKRTIEEYFGREQDRILSVAPLRLTGTRQKFDVFVNVRGGGQSGQGPQSASLDGGAGGPQSGKPCVSTDDAATTGLIPFLQLHPDWNIKGAAA